MTFLTIDSIIVSERSADEFILEKKDKCISTVYILVYLSRVIRRICPFSAVFPIPSLFFLPSEFIFANFELFFVRSNTGAGSKTVCQWRCFCFQTEIEFGFGAL